MQNKGFVSVDTLVSAVLLGIGDEQNKRYEIKATQWVFDTIRRIHVSYSPYYKEERMKFSNENIYSINYPNDLIKVLSVGLYQGAEFSPFTKKPDLSILASGGDNDEWLEDEGQGVTVSGSGYGAKGVNTAYWRDDPQHQRVIVRMLGTGRSERTNWLADKGVIVRYKASGLDCEGEVCVPIEARDLIIQKVIYEFIRRGWGIKLYNYNIQLQRDELEALQKEYEALLYEPHNFWEVKDSIYGSLNSVARR